MKLTLDQTEVKEAIVAYVIKQGFPVKAEDLEVKANADEYDVFIGKAKKPKKAVKEETPPTIPVEDDPLADIVDTVDDSTDEQVEEEEGVTEPNPFAPKTEKKGLFGSMK